MGIFSGKKKTYRDFSYARLIEDDYLPDVIGQAITTYVLSKDNTESLTDLMLEYGCSANNYKWNNAYRWAAKPGKYSYGVPKVTAVSQSDFTGAESLEEVLQTLTGQENLEYVYSNFGPGNFRHATWQRLISVEGYNPTTNILSGKTAALGTTCWLNNFTNYLTLATTEAVDSSMLEHWGYSPTSGATNTRTQDFTREDTADQTSTTGSNYALIEYACSFAGVSRINTVETTKITTTVKTPDGEGGYTEKSSETSSDTSTDTTDWHGITLPPDIISSIDVGTNTEESDEADPDTTETSTDPETGIITEVVTSVSRHITTKTVTVNVIATFELSFGSYDYNPANEDVDSETVVDDQDSGNYDPNAELDPSGESTTEDPDFFMVCYQWYSGDTPHIGYFTYQYGSGNYPSLDGITGTEVEDFGQHFPRMYFRLDGKSLISDEYKETTAYKTSKRFGKKLNISWLDVGDEIYSSISALDKVRDIAMVLMVPANTTNTLEQEYLYSYFYTLCMLRPDYTENEWTTQYTLNSTEGTEGIPSSDLDTFEMHLGAVIQSSDTATTSSNQMETLGYASIPGSIGGIGTTASGIGTGSLPIRYAYINSEEKGSIVYRYGLESVSYHYYQIQVTATHYNEVRVYNLKHQVTVGGGQVYRTGSNSELMVPLDHAFRKQFSVHDAETLYARSAQIIICTEYTIKSKWYSTSIFKAVTVVIAVALSWWTGGASLSLIGALTSAATALGTMLAFSLLSKYVFSKLGSWASILAAAVAVVAAAYAGYVYFSGSIGPFSLTAQNLMQISNIAFQASDASLKGQQIALKQKMGSLQKELELKQELLQTAQDELNQGSNTISDWVFLQASSGFVQLGETPEQMIARTLNTNIGVLALELPDMYLTQALSLPSSMEIIQQIQQSLYTTPDDELNPLM